MCRKLRLSQRKGCLIKDAVVGLSSTAVSWRARQRYQTSTITVAAPVHFWAALVSQMVVVRRARRRLVA